MGSLNRASLYLVTILCAMGINVGGGKTGRHDKQDRGDRKHPHPGTKISRHDKKKR